MNAADIVIPPAWHDLADKICRSPGGVLILGGADSGKSTLARFLALRCHEMGLRTVLVDSDVGQSLLGLPATVAFTPVTSAQCLETPALSFRFVGVVSPQGQVDRLITALGQLMAQVRELRPQVIVLDTTGFVHGPEGRHLKRRKIEIALPGYVVALQRAGELEHILTSYRLPQEVSVCRMDVCDHAKSRSRAERRRAREDKFGRYFTGANLVELSTEQVALAGSWFGLGRPVPEKTLTRLSDMLGTSVLAGQENTQEVRLILAGNASDVPPSELTLAFAGKRIRTVDVHWFARFLVGLSDERDQSLAMGIVKQLSPQKHTLLLHTPLASSSPVRSVEFGSLRLDPSGRELY